MKEGVYQRKWSVSPGSRLRSMTIPTWRNRGHAWRRARLLALADRVGEALRRVRRVGGQHEHFALFDWDVLYAAVDENMQHTLDRG